MQTAVVWSCLPFIKSGQIHLARHSERGKKTRRTKEEVGRQHQGMDMPRVRQVPEGSGEQGKMEKTGCKIICGAPTTFAVKGLMMTMMMMYDSIHKGVGIRLHKLHSHPTFGESQSFSGGKLANKTGCGEKQCSDPTGVILNLRSVPPNVMPCSVNRTSLQPIM